MNIIVVDDHEGFRAEMVHILSRDGHSVLATNSPDVARTLVETGHYDFVLIDNNMPRYDGIWFMKNVKRPKKTKVLLVTAHVDRVLIAEMFLAGAVGYIRKPLDEADLLWNLNFHLCRQ